MPLLSSSGLNESAVPAISTDDAATTTATHCPYCSLQCGMNVRDGVVSARDFPTNKGGLCQKGWTAGELLNHPDRLLTPLVRDHRGGELRPASWPEALDFIASRLLSLRAQFGADAVGVFGGGSLTNEKAYTLGKFARVALQTSAIDYNGRFCMSSAAAAGNKAFGIDRGLPFPLADIAEADTILLIGSNVAETMPPAMQYFHAQRQRGGQLIVVDPRLTPTATAASLHLQITPGTDAALALGLLNVCLRQGYIDESYIAQRTEGFAAVQQLANKYWPDRVERLTGIPEAKLNQAARMLGEARSAMILTARGPEQQSHGVNNVLAFINLALALGKVGRPFSGYGCLTGQGNGQGGREHGQKADQLPGYRLLANPADRAHVAAVWGVDPAELPKPGRSAYEMLDHIGQPDGVRALLVFGSNLVVSTPRAGHIQNRLGALDLLVVTDFFLSETAALADVVLPTAQWAEEEGTMTNLEGRVLLRRRVQAAPPGVWSELEILKALATRLGRGQFFSTDSAEVFAELGRATAGALADYSGITYERIEAEDGVFWPCPDNDHPGTPRLFLDRFPTPNGRARFLPVEFQPPAEEPDRDYPMYLTTGRVMAQYQSGTQTRRVKALDLLAPQATVQIHPLMARTFGVNEGDQVRLTTRRGTGLFAAALTPSIRMDTVFVPFHFAGEGRANLLTNDALDPVSRMPEFKVCAVRLEKSNPTC